MFLWCSDGTRHNIKPGLLYHANLRNQIVSYVTHLLRCSRIQHIPGSTAVLLVSIVCYPNMLYLSSPKFCAVYSFFIVSQG